MPGITVTFDKGSKIGPRFKARTTRFGERAILAIQGAAQMAADDMVELGQDDMRDSGNFGSARWQEGIHAKVSFQSRSDLRIRFTHDVPFWRVFEYGATIHGKPLLWIPLDFANVPKGMFARDFPEPLFRVDRQGKAPLLLSDTGPKFFGKESVTIPRKFHLRDVAIRVARQMGTYYKRAFANGG